MADFSQYETVLSNASATFQLNENTIRTQTDRAADGLADAGAQIEVAKAGLQTAIDQVAAANQTLKNALREGRAQNTELTYNLGTTKEALDVLKRKVEEERRLSEVRREQVAALENKDAGNYHSSWMGLFRPLKEESRVGLLIAAIAFLLAGIGGIYYGIRSGVWAVPEFLQRFQTGGRRVVKKLGRN